MEDVWKDIPGFEGFYQASESGKIKSLTRNKCDTVGRNRIFPETILEPINRRGYSHVSLYTTKLRIRRVNRLVALTFIPNPENKSQVNHINGVKSDDRVINLEWATDKENKAHAFATGLKRGRRGEESNFSKLKSEDVLIIRTSNESAKSLSVKHNVSISLISQIKNNKIWQHI